MKFNGIEYNHEEDIQNMVNSALRSIDKDLCMLVVNNVITQDTRMEILKKINVDVENTCGSCKIKWCDENEG